ncbi:homoserine kinase-like [Vigna radiata var. radiata]|uniref:Homoserine kinase-like n=1 Tax=Vigna radiata var. radiata TaxID=3916 RepID=A0A3Q0F313_VIGRR|nr:homoserine kinase-like [Vigna radiata var. radiata]
MATTTYFLCPSPTSFKGTEMPIARFRCCSNSNDNNNSVSLNTRTEPEPVTTFIKAFAPATVANLGLGFDFLSCAVDGMGDIVSVRVDPQVHPGEIRISDITGHAPDKLSKNPLWNCIGIAAIEVMKMLSIRSVSLSLSLQKGLPLGSGPGSKGFFESGLCVMIVGPLLFLIAGGRAMEDDAILSFVTMLLERWSWWQCDMVVLCGATPIWADDAHRWVRFWVPLDLQIWRRRMAILDNSATTAWRVICEDGGAWMLGDGGYRRWRRGRLWRGHAMMMNPPTIL